MPRSADAFRLALQPVNPILKRLRVSKRASGFGGTTMQARRKPFRVESMDRVTGRVNVHTYGHHSAHDEIMSELRALRTLVKPSEQVTQQMIDAYKAQIAEAAKLKSELDLIQDAITRTKQEIATVHVTGFEGPQMARVTNEL